MTRLNPADMVDTSRYPVQDLTSESGLQFAKQCRDSYTRTGLCMLPGFVRPDALEMLSAEANEASDKAYFCKSTHNAYLTEDDSTLSGDSVERRQEKTFVGSVAFDHIQSDALLRQLYLWDPLKDFIGFVLGKSPFYRFADPFGACSINVFADGGEHGWHFDESEFTVTLMLQPPEEGGAFEYVPLVRGRKDEREIVEQLLDGDRDRVVNLPFTAGALLIFGGRQTIHRVTKVTGSRPRLVPVLCYSERPGMQNSASVRQFFWGRPGPSLEAQA